MLELFSIYYNNYKQGGSLRSPPACTCVCLHGKAYGNQPATCASIVPSQQIQAKKLSRIVAILV